jgi:hypothetical protein
MHTISVANTYLPAFLVALIIELAAVERLKRCHPRIYKRLGSPKYGDSNLGKSIRNLRYYIWTFRFLRQRDPLLNTLFGLVIVGEVALLYLFFLFQPK